MKKSQQLYEGKAKRAFKTGLSDCYMAEYKDAATAKNGAKKRSICGKGEGNNRVSSHLLRLPEKEDVAIHVIQKLSPRETPVKSVHLIPPQVIARSVAASSFAARLRIPEGTRLPHTVVEHCHKNDELGDRMVNGSHIAVLNAATPAEPQKIERAALRINRFLTACLQNADLPSIDFKLEFGRDRDGNIMLADEISPDTCRFWNTKNMPIWTRSFSAVIWAARRKPATTF